MKPLSEDADSFKTVFLAHLVSMLKAMSFSSPVVGLG